MRSINLHWLFNVKRLQSNMALAKRKFEIGQIVYTKIAGYPPWPSCIIDIKPKNGKTKAFVRYFGWNSDM